MRFNIPRIVEAVRNEIDEWIDSCPYNGLEKYFTPDQVSEFIEEIVEIIIEERGNDDIKEFD